MRNVALILICLGSLHAQRLCTVTGRVCEWSRGTAGIPGVELTFKRELTFNPRQPLEAEPTIEPKPWRPGIRELQLPVLVTRVTTDVNGYYSVRLQPGKYHVRAAHRDYEDWSVYSVSIGDQSGTVPSIYLRRPRRTTVIVIRHAEKDMNYQGDDVLRPLSDAGRTRAKELVRVCRDLELGVSGIYATEFLRTQQTVEPLAHDMSLSTVLYGCNDVAGLKQKVLADHKGDVVVVAGHSDTVDDIVHAFGGPDGLSIGDQYDNLFVVSVPVSGFTETVNLRYGAR